MNMQTQFDPEVLEQMQCNAQNATEFLKALAHEGRLMILCHLAAGEKSVTELEDLLNARQAAVSQQLARLRHAGFVTCRREGKAMYYTLPEGAVRDMIGILYDMFCAAQEEKGQPEPGIRPL